MECNTIVNQEQCHNERSTVDFQNGNSNRIRMTQAIPNNNNPTSKIVYGNNNESKLMNMSMTTSSFDTCNSSIKLQLESESLTSSNKKIIKGGNHGGRHDGDDIEEVSSNITNFTNCTNHNDENSASNDLESRSSSYNQRHLNLQPKQQKSSSSPIIVVYPPPISWYQEGGGESTTSPEHENHHQEGNNGKDEKEFKQNKMIKNAFDQLSPLSFDGGHNNDHNDKIVIDGQKARIKNQTHSNVAQIHYHHDILSLPDIQNDHEHDGNHQNNNHFHLQQKHLDRYEDTTGTTATAAAIGSQRSSINTMRHNDSRSINISSPTRSIYSTRSRSSNSSCTTPRTSPNRKKRQYKKKSKKKEKSSSSKTTTDSDTLSQKTTQQLSATMKSFHTITTDYLPNAAQELIYTSSRNLFHYTRKTYNQSMLFGKMQFKFSEVGNMIGGYDYETLRKEGICDESNGDVLWSMDSIRDKHYYHFNDDYVSTYNTIDDGSELCDMAIKKKKKTKKRMMDQHCKRSMTKTKIDPMTSSSQKGFGWEDEWDRQRVALPPFSSLNWVDRQLVKEWRTCEIITPEQQLHIPNPGKDSMSNAQNHKDPKEENGNSSVVSDDHEHDGEDMDFDQARKVIPKPMPRPPWENALTCYACRKTFNSTRLRHHCRLCGRSYCHEHSKYTHRLPHLGYDPDIPERTCGQCKQYLEMQNFAERIAWRMARCRDYLASPIDLCPYFETGIDTIEDAALRLTKAAINLAKSIPLGAQATVAVETLDVLRKHGLKGIYGLILRKEFLAAADLLCKVTGINKKVWPLSVHELSAAIFYALAQHRALRGVDPEREHRCHALKKSNHMVNDDDDDDNESYVSSYSNHSDQTSIEDREIISSQKKDPQHGESEYDELSNDDNINPVCEAVSDSLLASLIFYAPVAMNFIYATTEVDMQLLAAQQGWRLIYAHLKQDVNGSQISDMPASALFVHEKQKVACFSIRGTATINDVVTDIRAMPVQFPDSELTSGKNAEKPSDVDEDDWMKVSKGQGLALCGMAGASYNLFRENIETLLLFASKGYRIRLVGHSLGGGVAALLGALVRREIQSLDMKQVNEKAKDSQDEVLRVYSYGSPACVDAKLSDYAKSYVTNCVLHDDVIPRLTPTSIRALLKHLLYIRETWVKAHLTDDLMAITERAKTAWAPRLRNGFSLKSAKKPSLKLYKKIKAKGSSIQNKLIGQKVDKEKSKDSVIKDKADDNIANENEILQSIEGSIYEGDYFYEAEELIENSEEELSKAAFQSDDILDDLPKDMDNSSQAVILEEAPLPRMFIPGKILHIYTHRGGYKIAQVPREFRELREISLAGNMLSDHMSKTYYEALLECKAVRRAKNSLPSWTSFGEENTCACCASRFTWASTSDSEAQEARDKHNCRFCGCLVCAPCSSNRVPIPDIGISIPSRVCDRCYHDMGSALTDDNALTRSFMEESNHSSVCDDNFKVAAPAKEKVCMDKLKCKPKRSEVVDELILRMPKISLENCA